MAGSGCLVRRKCGIGVRRALPEGLETRFATGLAHAEGDEIAGRLFLAPPVVQGHDLIHIRPAMSHGHDLDHIRTMVDTFLHHGLERLEGIRALEIVERTDEDRAVLMGAGTHALRHLLLRLELHIDETGTRLDGPYEPFLRNLHSLYLSALLRQILQRRLSSGHLRYTAGRHQRHIGGKEFIDVGEAERASVQTYLRHLALFQSLIYLLQIPVLYGSTNHVSFSFLLHQTADLIHRQGV